MARTINRQPLSVSTSSSDYTKTQFFNQVSFKGLYDQKNDVGADQLSFTDACNVYVDENSILTSRPPFKFSDGEAFVVDEWRFGSYGLRLHRLITNSSLFSFVMRCFTHETDNDYEWQIPVSVIGYDDVPKVTCAQVEDKIFVWFAGIDFICLNTAGTTPYFESAGKYLYTPIRELIINGIKTDYETENYLTSEYIRRHQYSALSDINFDALLGKSLSVSLNGPMTNNTSKHLYDINPQLHQNKMMVYPYAIADTNYDFDIVQTSRATVFLRYHNVTNVIDFSFDGKYYKPLPLLRGGGNIIDKPMLTRDGLWAVVFTQKGLAKCKLVAQDSTDLADGSEVLQWVIEPYMKRHVDNGIPAYVELANTSFKPAAYFETIDNFAYVFRASGGAIYLYTEWLNGNNQEVWGFTTLTNDISGDNLKLHFRYVTPTQEHPKLGAVVAIMTDSSSAGTVPQIVTYLFEQVTETLATKLQNGDKISLPIASNGATFENKFVYKLQNANTGIASLAQYTGDIVSGDDVLITDVPLRFLGQVPLWSNATTYFTGQYCLYNNAYYLCIVAHTGHAPTDGVNSYYWQFIGPSYWEFYGAAYEDKYARVSWDTYYQIFGPRYKITTNENLSIIQNGMSITLTPLDLGLYQYTASELETRFGPLLVYTIDTDLFVSMSWADFMGGMHPLYFDNTSKKQSGTLSVFNTHDTANLAKDPNYLSVAVAIPDTGYTVQSYGAPCRNADIQISVPVVSTDKVHYEFLVAHNATAKNSSTLKSYNLLTKVAYDYDSVNHLVNNITKTVTVMSSNVIARRFRFMQNTDIVLSNKYLYIAPNAITLPQNGELANKSSIIPINIDGPGVWYNIDGTLWTSQMSDDVILEVDERVAGTMNTDVPAFHATMNEHYFVFSSRETGEHLLEVTSVRRDEDKLFNDTGTDLLLYLPKTNEQKFSNEITALHPLSNTEMGIFTENEIWYVSTVNNDGTVMYTKPVKSKVPAGCRKGCQVITALDGQALIFPTARGITALAPQDFIATTEKTLSYLSDAIQERYYKFYTNEVIGIDENNHAYHPPHIRICTYKYWLLFYRHMDRQILALDTRDGSWWSWTTPYPTIAMSTGSRLHILMQLDFMNDDSASLLGVPFIWTDRESQEITEDGAKFPEFSDESMREIGYYDDTVENAVNGLITVVHENDRYGDRVIRHRASSTIDWYVVSQRLHFEQINNYKCIKGLTVNLKGLQPLKAKLSTKAFRDVYHPEDSDSVEVKINELRTFLMRLHLMHVVNFQYRLENDIEEMPTQLKLNSLSIKYEVKERVR